MSSPEMGNLFQHRNTSIYTGIWLNQHFVIKTRLLMWNARSVALTSSWTLLLACTHVLQIPQNIRSTFKGKIIYNYWFFFWSRNLCPPTYLPRTKRRVIYDIIVSFPPPHPKVSIVLWYCLRNCSKRILSSASPVPLPCLSDIFYFIWKI